MSFSIPAKSDMEGRFYDAPRDEFDDGWAISEKRILLPFMTKFFLFPAQCVVALTSLLGFTKSNTGGRKLNKLSM